jgi:beta-glucosidase
VREGGRGPSIWDTFSHEPGRIRDGSTGDVATDHYHRYRADVALMAGLGLRSYRFSIAWPRIMPTGTGPVNPQGLDFYKRLVAELLANDITPVATLYHWDLPQALQDRGGWFSRDCAAWFADYAAAVVGALGDLVPTWLTINEPKTIVQVAYEYGAMAPGDRDPAHAAVVAHHLLLAHGRAVQAARASGHRVRVAPALNLAPVYPAAPANADDVAAATLADGTENRLYLDPILTGSYPADLLAAWDDGVSQAFHNAVKDGDLGVIATPVDLLAVHYYNPVFVAAGGEYLTLLPTSEANWQQIYPVGLYDILTRVARDYGNPAMTITENGRPTTDAVDRDGVVEDADRIDFLREHLAAAHRAISEGVRLEGFHVWSLLDNFEWAEGYSQRWGMVYVDHATLERTPKASATWYQNVIARNGI